MSQAIAIGFAVNLKTDMFPVTSGPKTSTPEATPVLSPVEISMISLLKIVALFINTVPDVTPAPIWV